MKRYVKQLSYAGALVIMLTLIIGCIAVFNHVQQKMVRESLEAMLHTADTLLNAPPQDLDRLTEQLAQGDSRLRVTFLNAQGQVLSDSAAQAAVMTSHLDRAEIAGALAGETGISIRKSATTGVQTIYAAKQVGENLLLRLSYPASATQEFLWLLLPVAAGLAVAIIAAVPFFAARVGKKVTQPLILINNMLMDKGDDTLLREDAEHAEPEVRPILTNIGYLIEKLQYDFEEVQRTQQIRSDFVANASHELKTPLTSIKGFAELLAGDMVPDKEKRKIYLKRIATESDRLLNIINDILRLSKAESKAVGKTEQVLLQPLSRDVLQALEPLARQRGIALNLDGTGRVIANAKDVWELLYNLVDNAIRYSKPGGRVDIHLGDCFLAVEDNGIGIEEEQLPRIFERFYRIDTSHSRQTGGTGLGLSIVKHIAQNYGGRIQVKSRPGEGSTFSVQFPCDIAPESASGPAENKA